PPDLPSFPTRRSSDLDLGEVDVDLWQAGLAATAEQFRQAVQGLRPEDQVHVGSALHDRRALLAGDAAADADQHRPATLLEALPSAKLAEDLLLCFFAYRAGIDQDHVCFVDVRGD